MGYISSRTGQQQAVNPYTGTQLSARQQEILNKQKAQLGETKYNEAITATQNSQAAQQAKQDLANLQAMKAGQPQVRSQALVSTAPTPANPMKEVSAQGANVVKAPTPSPVTPPPTNLPAPTIQYAPPAQSQYVAETPKPDLIHMDQVAKIEQPKQGGYNKFGGLGYTMEDYMNMTPEQQIYAQAQGVQQQGQMQGELQNRVFDEQRNILAKKQEDLESKLADQRAEEEAANAAKVKQFEADQAAQIATATTAIERAAQQRQETADTTLAFQGFGRSSKAMEIRDNIRQDTQAQIADINRQSTRSVDEYRASLLDKTNAKLEKIQEKIDLYGDAQDQTELAKVKAQGDLMMDLFKQNPLSPANMINTAQALQKTRLEQQKADAEEAKALRDDTRANFQFMVTNFGSGYVQNLDQESLETLAHNMNISPAALASVGKTLKEQDQEWEQMKYTMDKSWEQQKIANDQNFQLAMNDLGYRQSLEKMGIQFDYDNQKMYLGEQFKTDAARQKYLNSAYGTFAGQASGADGSSLYFGAPTEVNGKMVIASNPKLVDAYPAGYKKDPGKDGYGGQCAYEAQQMVNCPKLGNTREQKLKTLAGLVQQGRAFYKGQGQPQVGNTIISNDSKQYGHVSVINSIKPDGTLVLSEFNRLGALKFSNTREIKPDDPSIYGFIATQPKPQYQVAKNAEKLASDAIKGNMAANAIGAVAGATPLGDFFVKGAQAFQRAAATSQGKELMTAAQVGETNYENKIEDEAGNILTPQREAVRSGMELPADYVQEMRQFDPQGYQQYVSDLTYSKQNPTMKQADATEVRQVRKEYNTVAQKTQEINQQGQNLVTTWDAYKAGKVGAQVADNALIMTFSKMLDPGSVVREGEFDRVVRGQPLLQYAQNFVTAQATGGYALDDKTRSELVLLAKEFMNNQNQKMQSLQEFYNTEAEYLGVDPSRITGGYNNWGVAQTAPGQTTQTPPANDLELYNSYMPAGGGFNQSDIDFYNNL